MFHPRPDSPLHLPNEEPVLGYLKFSAKGTKREVFGMHIPNKLITASIQGEQYYKEYLKKVAKHQRYLTGEKGSDPDSPIPKPAKATKKSKPSAPKADLRPPPSPARRSKPGLVTKRRKPTSSLRSADESVDEGIPEKEHRFDDEETDVQRALEESLKSVYDAPRGPLPPTPKKKSHADQYIFQRRTSTPTESSGHDKSSSLYTELRLTDCEVESDKEVPGINARVQDKGQAGPNPGTLSSPQHLAKDLSFGDLFFNDKPSEANNEKTTAETEAESMVSVTIQQDTSSIPPMTTLIIDLNSRPDSPNVHRKLQATATKTTTATTTTTHPPPPQPQQSTTDSMLMNCIGELEQIMANLIQDNKHLEERLDSYGAPLEKSMNRDHTDALLKDLAEARKKKKKRRDSPKNAIWVLTSSSTSSSTTSRLHMDDDMALDAQVRSSDDEDIRNTHIPKVNLQQDWWKPPEEDRPVKPEPAWHNVNKPLPLGGPPGQMKATYYPDVGLEKMVLDQMWIDEECKYDIAAMYGFEYKHDYMVIDSPRAVAFRDKYEVQMIMRFNEIHKFSNDTLHQIDEALDYRVKEFKVNRMNLDLNTRVKMEIMREPTSNKILVANELTDAFGKPFEKSLRGMTLGDGRRRGIFVDYVEGSLCVDNTDAGIVGRCNSGSNKNKDKELWDLFESKYIVEYSSSKNSLSFKTLCLLNYALMKRHDYDITVFFTKRGITIMLVNTRTDADLSAAVQNALQTLLPQIRAEIREEFRTSSGPLDSGGNPSPITSHTWLKRFNKQNPRSFEKATAPVDVENWIYHMEKIFDVMG
nr:zinc finger, CCHC-type, retrotransposon Gag domain protein [Tanacetum cinerariifolium]